jgi:O-antigen/teichoic acid export membrane protein
MNHLKNLAGQTVIYGVSTIVTRFLNYLLTPFYTYIFINPAAFGDVTILYAYVTFLNIILTYGMETGLFYFAKREEDFARVYGTAFYSLLATTAAFMIVSFIFLKDIAGWVGYAEKVRYVFWFILILGVDTLTAIPFAKLRQKNNAFRFAFLKLINVIVTIFFNVLLIWMIPKFFLDHGKFFGITYKVDVELIFISNFLGSLCTFFLLFPDLFGEKMKFCFTLWKRMFNYSYPILFAGLVGVINETLDRILLENYLPADKNAMAEVGIYGAGVRLAMLMTIFTQMFRFAAEPFFFGRHKNDDQKIILADVTKYFFLFGLIIFLGVMSYIDILKYFIGPTYREGISIVPVYLLGSLGLGVYFNLSFWYKLNGKTYFGILITGIGAFITIVINVIFIPQFSYHASAWARCICYGVIVLISYLLGQKYYPVKYPVKSMMMYFLLALVGYILISQVQLSNRVLDILKNTLIFVSFIVYFEYKEKLITIFFKK